MEHIAAQRVGRGIARALARRGRRRINRLAHGCLGRIHDGVLNACWGALVPVNHLVLLRPHSEGGGVILGVHVVALVACPHCVHLIPRPRRVLRQPSAEKVRVATGRGVVAFARGSGRSVRTERSLRFHHRALQAHSHSRQIPHGRALRPVPGGHLPRALVERKVRRHVLQVLVRRAVHGGLDLRLSARHLPQLHLVHVASLQAGANLQRVEVRVLLHGLEHRERRAPRSHLPVEEDEHEVPVVHRSHVVPNVFHQQRFDSANSSADVTQASVDGRRQLTALANHQIVRLGVVAELVEPPFVQQIGEARGRKSHRNLEPHLHRDAWEPKV
mmetsp:Transcript_19463/g.37574  ORF Transcript_19463/g.37574 Transcript_19463/m.37574 type:complete len:330 (-) Transcript_19463:2931-3920(-)